MSVIFEFRRTNDRTLIASSFTVASKINKTSNNESKVIKKSKET